MNKSFLALCIAASLTLASAAQAADVRMLNVDAAGVGLNDATPVAPVGGNPGTTRGEQARYVYQFAMDMWGGVLESPVTINVQASFAPLACTASSGTLASAGTSTVLTGTIGARPARSYGSALVDAISGYDVIEDIYGSAYAGYPDIVSQFNGKLGQTGCLDGMSWYFGLDGATPAGQVNFLNVVMHEIGHGLGVQGFLNRTTTSANFGANSYSAIDVFTANAYDNVINKPFSAMTPLERKAALLAPGRTVWTGANVNSQAPSALNSRYGLRASAPAAIAGLNYEIGFAAFGPLVSPANFPDRELVLINDGNIGAGTATDGCSANGAATTNGDTITYVNAAAVAGKVAVIDRGTCSFEYKSRIAQDNGAVGVIIVNNAAGVIDMAVGAVRTSVSIPTLMVSQADGAQIKANIAGARAGVLASSGLLAGADNSGRVRLYTPATYAPGSTFSHFDTALTPNALMEPFDTPEVQGQFNVDLTPGVFADIGWTLNPGNGKIVGCDTGVDAVANAGIVLGANVQATNNLCKTSAGRRTDYTACMYNYRDDMRADGLLNSSQTLKLNTCIKKQSDQFGR